MRPGRGGAGRPGGAEAPARTAGGAWRFLELAALCALAVAQPVFQALAGAPEFLVMRGAGGSEIVQMAVALVVVPPVLLWCLGEALARRAPGRRRQVHAALVAGLFGALALQVLKRATGLPSPGLVAGAAAGAAGFGWTYLRWRVAALWLRTVSPAPIAFAALFLFASPVSALLGPPPPLPATPAAAEPAPVVLVILDELPLVSMLDARGQIDARLYPNFAALAAESTFFRNATGVAARTVDAVPAMLTGRFPRPSLAPTASQHPRNLFALLAPSHDVRAFESVTALCPVEECPSSAGRVAPGSLLRDAAEVWWQAVTPVEGHQRDLFSVLLSGDRSPAGPPPDDDAPLLYGNVGENQPERFREFLDSIDGAGVPFHFLHLLLPHQPWQYLPDGLQYRPRDIGLVSYDQRTEEPWPALLNRQRHALQAMYVDTLLGRIVERLREVGLYDRTSLLVTADHGISFTPGLRNGTREMTPGNEHEVAWVPFLLKVPGQTTGALSDANVMAVDVAPTVAELAGAGLPWDADGVSLVSQDRAPGGKVWFNRPARPIDVDDLHYDLALGSGIGTVVRAEEGVDGVFRVGPFADMVGSAVDRYRVAGQAPVAATVDGVAAFDRVDQRSGLVPSLVSGRLEGPLPDAPALGLAISVNGTIGAVSELFGHRDGALSFAGMVSPAHLVPGANRLEAYLLQPEGDGVVLRPVPLTQEGRLG